MNSIRKGFKPQTLLIRNKESNIVSNREKILQRWSAYYEKHYELQDGTITMEKSRQCAYNLQNHVVNHQMM